MSLCVTLWFIDRREQGDQLKALGDAVLGGDEDIRTFDDRDGRYVEVYHMAGWVTTIPPLPSCDLLNSVDLVSQVMEGVEDTWDTESSADIDAPLPNLGILAYESW